MTFLDFDGRQYYMRVVSEEEDPFQARAYSTSVAAATILNVAELGEDAEDGWQFCRYTFPMDGAMRFRFVRPARFADVEDSPGDVRRLLEDNVDDESFYEEFYFSCERLPCPEPEAAEQSDAADKPGEERTE